MVPSVEDEVPRLELAQAGELDGSEASSHQTLTERPGVEGIVEVDVVATKSCDSTADTGAVTLLVGDDLLRCSVEERPPLPLVVTSVSLVDGSRRCHHLCD